MLQLQVTGNRSILADKAFCNPAADSTDIFCGGSATEGGVLFSLDFDGELLDTCDATAVVAAGDETSEVTAGPVSATAVAGTDLVLAISDKSSIS